MKVLVPIDDSRYSDLALSSITARQWASGTKFLLYTVVNDCDTSARFLPLDHAQTLRRLEGEQEQEAMTMLQCRCDTLRLALPGMCVDFSVGCGDPAAEIIEMASAWDAGLVVMGSHDRRNLQLYALGSVTQKVIEKVPCSLEIIRTLNQSEEAWHDQRRILVCCDGSRNSQAAVEWVANGAWATDQEFTLVSVLAPIENNLSPAAKFRQRKVAEIRESAFASAQEALARHTDRLRQALPSNSIDCHVLEGSAAETIIELVESWSADLIVIGAHDEIIG